MTAETFLTTLIEACLPDYTHNIVIGSGKSLLDFLQSESTAKPSAFISYEGWNETDGYSNGTATIDEENYSIFLRTDGNVKSEARALKNGLLAEDSMFVDENDREKYVLFLNGKAYRDFGSDAFEIMVTIK